MGKELMPRSEQKSRKGRGKLLRKLVAQQDLSASALLTLWAGAFLCVGAGPVLCIAGRLAAPRLHSIRSYEDQKHL